MNTFRMAISGAALAAGLSFSLPSAAEERDGSHDFDFNLGVWHTDIHRVLDPFEGGTKTLDLSGTVTVRPVWGGKAQLEEIEADGPNGHWEGLTLFMYNPKAHQWNQTFINSKMGELNPPAIGEFKNGMGELVAADTYQGRAVLVRVLWSEIKPDSHHLEELYSEDGGQSWHAAFIANLTRVKP
jgi:hypothetical protein